MFPPRMGLARPSSFTEWFAHLRASRRAEHLALLGPGERGRREMAVQQGGQAERGAGAFSTAPVLWGVLKANPAHASRLWRWGQ